jgi:hypothetical protein
VLVAANVGYPAAKWADEGQLRVNPSGFSNRTVAPKPEDGTAPQQGPISDFFGEQTSAPLES